MPRQVRTRQVRSAIKAHQHNIMKLKTHLILPLLITTGLLCGRVVMAQRRTSPAQPSQPAPSLPPPINGSTQVQKPFLPNPQPPVAPDPLVPAPQPDNPIIRYEVNARDGKSPMNPQMTEQHGFRTNTPRRSSRRVPAMTNFPPPLTNRIPPMTNTPTPLTNRVPALRMTNHLE
jgi:hypothetical protein